MSLLPGHQVPVNIGMVEEEDGVIWGCPGIGEVPICRRLMSQNPVRQAAKLPGPLTRARALCLMWLCAILLALQAVVAPRSGDANGIGREALHSRNVAFRVPNTS